MNTHNTETAAKYLQCEPCTVRTLIKNGELAAAKIGRGYVIRQQVLDEFIAKREQSTAQAVQSEQERTSSCPSTNAKMVSTTLTLQHRAVKDLDSRLAQKTKKPPKSCTIN